MCEESVGDPTPDKCPACGEDDIQPHPSKEPRAHGMLWCPDCENEVWREGSTWWKCGHDGEVVGV